MLPEDVLTASLCGGSGRGRVNPTQGLEDSTKISVLRFEKLQEAELVCALLPRDPPLT